MLKFFSKLINKKENKKETDKKVLPISDALEAETLRRLGDYKNALVHIEKAINGEPNNDMFYATKAQILIKMNDSHNATKAINKAIELNPNIIMYKKIHEEIMKL
ncbi:MAG: tetratricopeptide repeat protein [Cyanobacteria bacterium SIG29]|nr:tetratricopeptide repeat protein [Cyanobacteria bacterium SIG29]